MRERRREGKVSRRELREVKTLNLREGKEESMMKVINLYK